MEIGLQHEINVKDLIAVASAETVVTREGMCFSSGWRNTAVLKYGKETRSYIDSS